MNFSTFNLQLKRFWMYTSTENAIIIWKEVEISIKYQLTQSKLQLLYDSKLGTPTPSIQFLFFLRWSYWSFSQNPSIFSEYNPSDPCFTIVSFINPYICSFGIFSSGSATYDIKKCLFYNSVLQTVEGDDS